MRRVEAGKSLRLSDRNQAHGGWEKKLRVRQEKKEEKKGER